MDRMEKELPIKITLPDGFLKEEVRSGYTVSTTMKAVWAVELDLYQELNRVCEKYGLTLYADAGTILGAVRHNGFIPWDDDMDFGITRDDFEKLCSVAEKEFTEPYFWQTEETDPGTCRGHGQLRNSLTTALVPGEKEYERNHGIFIDVFVYDPVPSNKEERHAFFHEVESLNQKRKRYREYYFGVNNSVGVKRLLKSILLPVYHLLHPVYHNQAYTELEKLRQKYRGTDAGMLSNLSIIILQRPDRTTFRKEVYEFTVSMPFEMMEIAVPHLYEEYLTVMYGDWRIPVKGAVNHGEIFFDPYHACAEK